MVRLLLLMTENVSSGLSHVNLPHPDSSWGQTAQFPHRLLGLPLWHAEALHTYVFKFFSAHDQVEQVFRRQLSTEQISQQASAPRMRQWPQGIPKTTYLTVSSFIFPMIGGGWAKLVVLSSYSLFYRAKWCQFSLKPFLFVWSRGMYTSQWYILWTCMDCGRQKKRRPENLLACIAL